MTIAESVEAKARSVAVDKKVVEGTFPNPNCSAEETTPLLGPPGFFAAWRHLSDLHPGWDSEDLWLAAENMSGETPDED